MRLQKSLQFKFCILISWTVVTFLSSCSNELELIKASNPSKNKVSFSQFLEETGIKDFNTKFHIPRETDFAARNADGSYELSDFDIDTSYIKKITIDLNTTYSFLIRPKIIKDATIFNLTVSNVDGVWQKNIFELKPTEVTWEQLKIDPKTPFQGKIKRIYSDSVYMMQDGMCSWVMMLFFHCSGFSQCANGCDGCTTGEDACVTIRAYQICTELDVFIAPVDGVNPGNNGGGGVPAPFSDPTGATFDPNLPEFTSEYFNMQRRIALWQSLTDDPEGQQAWAVDHSYFYSEIADAFIQYYPAITTVEAAQIMDEMEENPELFDSPKTLLIEKLIDDSQLDDCSKDVLSQLKELEQNDISALFKKLNDPLGIYKVTMKIENYTSQNLLSVAHTNWETHPNNSNLSWPYNYVTKIKPSYINHIPKPTKLSIARTILHELFHAYLDSMFDDCYYAGNCIAVKEFPDLWDAYVAFKSSSDDASLADHVAIANIYVDKIAKALQEFNTGVPVGDNVEPLQEYKDLAWYGLQETPAFSQVYPLNSPDYIRWYNRNQAENVQQTTSQIQPISSACN